MLIKAQPWKKKKFKNSIEIKKKIIATVILKH
jgi:hypothetical protein